MSAVFDIHTASLSEDGEQVIFAIRAGAAAGRGFVSRSALDALTQGQIGRPIDVFHAHRDRILEAARQKWAADASGDVALNSWDF
ncbi:hypothetical protein BKK79_01080 [Cupriavidus sp. USMAA2-4]|uniref:DUF1488 domain-containing protein n=1 Tax=Cupriavidus malaysiensis TaxID=367825 RepID=A0ABN4TGZ9_9BURK|nr:MULTISPECIES: DUF1488 family protein [Cupriavidus]AOY90578.1 hypothetical protein BKK79_01080 [Cupriavidus sp. USMAA2-4]AOY99796.1 hypothetical protein BKK81_11495 [Cupriavidus sp. USMAHM13]AOZ06422.1 hypothetical protein BKK80_11765 [Cupriavidus malaysiensis]